MRRELRRGEKTLWKTYATHAWTDEVGETVVVDELSTELSACDEIEACAKRLVGSRHPNVATVRDVVVADGALRVTSDFVQGERLDVLAASGKLTPEIALRVVIDVLHALGALHDTSVVHGHVEPANVIVGEDGVARLVRAWLGPTHFVVIEAGAMHRVAPEILRERGVDGRADVYGAGVLLKELLSEPLPDWAAPIADVTANALASDPVLRHATTADMARALRVAAQSHVASQSKVASFVRRAAGEAIDARFIELAPPKERPADPEPAVTRAEHVVQVVGRRSGRTTRVLRASLDRMSRLWAATVGLVVALAVALAWLALHPARASSRPSPAAPPVATADAPAPNASASTTAAPESVEIALPEDAPATSTSAATRAPRRAPRKRVDRSAVF
jgi:serine/threonine-protein kinase